MYLRHTRKNRERWNWKARDCARLYARVNSEWAERMILVHTSREREIDRESKKKEERKHVELYSFFYT